MPRLISHHTSHLQSRTPRRDQNRPACARPVAGAAALECAQQVYLVSRLVTTGWAVLASSQPRDVASGDARLPRDAKCASATCAPLRRRQVACLSPACPSAAAALLCHLGPLLHFKKSASGCCQPPPAGGPPTADLSNCTRRAGRRCPAPPGPTRCRGAQGICPLPGPRRPVSR